MSKARDIADLDFNSPDIDGGNIDGAVIGGTTPAAGTFSGLTTDSLNVGTTSDAYSSIFLISSATNGESELRMGDTDTDAGSIAYTNADNTMTFRAAAASRMTIDSAGIDVAGLVKIGVNNSEYANNYIRFKPTGAAYIDHNTVGQSINFRTSVSSSLDTTPLTIASSGAATFSSSVRGTQLEAYKTNHGGDVSVAANQVGNAYENLASTASLILGATATSTINSTKIVADHSGGATNNHIQDLVFYPVGGNSQNFEAMRISSLGALTVKNVANGHTVFNEDGVDADFRVESAANSHMLFVDGGTNRVGIGTFSQGPRALLDMQGSTMPETGDAASVEDMLTLYRNGSASVWSGGATLSLGRYSTGGGSAPKSRLDFKLKNAAGSNTALPETTVMSLQSQGAIGFGTTVPAERLHGHNGSGNDGTYLRLSGGGSLNESYGGWMRGYGVQGSGGYLELGVVDAGTKKTALYVTAQGNDLQLSSGGVVRQQFDGSGNTVFNESGATSDFRVETDAQSHMLYLSGGSNRLHIGGSDSHNSGDTVHLQQLNNRHGLGIVSHHSVSASGPAECVQGCFSCSTVSAGNKITIPITAQSNLWRRATVEIMVQSSEYNMTVGNRGGTAAFTFGMLSYVNGLQQLRVDGNISSITASGANIEINFTTGFTGGLSNHEGCMVYYKILSDQPDYVQVWNAVLN